MITQAVHGGGTSPTITRHVYYVGTDTLGEGYALCYNFDAYDVSAENLSAHLNTGDYGVDDACPARRIQVEKPSINNCAHFAGVVSDKSDGVTGPAWVEINLPGSTCNIYCNANVDHGSTGVGMNTGQMLTFSTDQYYFKYTGVPGKGSAIILQDVDRSSTAGLVQAELCVGPPSGGYQVVASTHFSTAHVVSTGGAVCIAPFGTTAVTSGAFTALNLTAALTATLTAADAEWIGQTKRFEILTSVGANAFAVTVSTSNYVNASALRATSAGSLTASLVSDNDAILATWTGSQWAFMVSGSTVGVV